MDMRWTNFPLTNENTWVSHKCFLNRRIALMKVNLCPWHSELNGGKCGGRKTQQIGLETKGEPGKHRYKKPREEKREEGFGLTHSDRVWERTLFKRRR